MGDIRRYIIQGGKLDALVHSAMNAEPVLAEVGTPDNELYQRMGSHNIRALPLVDVENKYVRTIHEMELGLPGQSQLAAKSFSVAVIMAGGRRCAIEASYEKPTEANVKN